MQLSGHLAPRDDGITRSVMPTKYLPPKRPLAEREAYGVYFE
jgi:hypothetical protein